VRGRGSDTSTLASARRSNPGAGAVALAGAIRAAGREAIGGGARRGGRGGGHHRASSRERGRRAIGGGVRRFTELYIPNYILRPRTTAYREGSGDGEYAIGSPDPRAAGGAEANEGEGMARCLER
jgi:hypothetical protein